MEVAISGNCAKAWDGMSTQRTHEDEKNFLEIFLKTPLTSRSPSAIIRAQVEARQSPERVRPMRVRKTKPMKPPQGERGILCGI